MKNVSSLDILFNASMRHSELPLFCGAVIKALPHDSVLFHNHLGIGLRYGYPLIQYKTIKGKAAIVCVGKGTESVWDFFARNNFDLTFHDTQECRYQLGMAKAYGFGKCRYNIKLNITAVPQGSEPKDAEFYMARFEDYMSRHVAGPWIQQHPIKGLFTMAGNDVANGGAFDFMTMTNNKDTNEFEKAKTAHEYLQRATSLLPSVVPKTLCDTPDFKAEMEIVRMQEEKKQAEKDRLRRQKELETFKEDYEQRITLSGTDKSLFNNIKAELVNLRTDDKGKQDIITGLLAKIDQIIAQMPQAGFHDAFKTAIVDYKLFETRVKAGLRKTPLDKLTQADKDFGAAKLQEAYDHDDKKSPKDWAVTTGRYFKKCVKIVGNDIATEWFTKLKR